MPNKKHAILRAATILFAEKGFNETSTAELAKITDSAEGTIFYHFKTKNDILIEVLENVEKGIVQEFEEYIGKKTFNTGLERVEEIISFLLYLAAHREEWFRLLQRNFPYEHARLDENCRNHLKSIYNTIIDFIENAIQYGINDGSIRELPVHKVALILYSTVTGIIWFRFQGIYDTAILYEELLISCRRILQDTNGR